MEKLKRKCSSLQNYFVLIVLITFFIVICLSLLSIWGCQKFREYLLPDSNTIWVTLNITYSDGKTEELEFSTELGQEMYDIPRLTGAEGGSINNSELSDIKTSIEKIENNFDMLTPKRKIAYQICGISMIAMPMIFSIVGILICGFIFYRKKLNKPLKLLENSMEQISNKNLDFKLSYTSNDEMGKLCNSFEKMRQILEETNKELWKMIEERRLVQASVAHDLRNPISIIEGYTEYLQTNLQNDNLSKEKILEITSNINKTAKRLERYTDSIRTINALEDIEVNRKEISTRKFIEDVKSDLKQMTKSKGIGLDLKAEKLFKEKIKIDSYIIYRILENIVNNALRYSKEKINLSFNIQENYLIISIVDDGIGFSEDVLKERNNLIIPTASDGEHCGLGLIISRILCKKHGGKLELSNDISGGAKVKIFIEI